MRQAEMKRQHDEFSSSSEGDDLPKGIQMRTALPNQELGALWDSIVLDESIKDQLLSQAVLNFTIRPQVSRSVLPLHGIILLVGAPGTGKTSLAKGLAHRVAHVFNKRGFKLLEVDPHALTSSAMGKTQRAVTDLFSQSVSEAAMTGPTIVLLDEVETLAVDRSRLSMEANPIDIHRATDAVLVQLDLLAEKFPNLLFVATSNFPDAVDTAFTSRCDLVIEIPVPDLDACERILVDCLKGLGEAYPEIGKLAQGSGLKRLATACVGLDGRALRKMVAVGLAGSRETAKDPNKLTLDQLVNAAQLMKTGSTKGGRK